MLTIITLNFNGAEKTIKLLRSLKDQTDKDFQVIVIDNASEEADFEKLDSHTRTPQVQIIKNSQNLGFSGGNNVGIKKALENGSEWLVLLNNDTWLETAFISQLKANLSGKEGIVGIPLVEGDKTAYYGQTEWLKPTLGHIYRPIKDKLPESYAIGGAMAIHKTVFNKIGLLDENYFLYFEDADFSIRAKKAGLPLTSLEAPKANHQVSATTSKLGRSLLLRYHYRNALYFNFKNGPTEVKIAIPVWSFFLLLKQSVKIALGIESDISGAIIRGILDYHLERMGKINSK